MTLFFIGLILGLYCEWKFEIAKYVIESVKEHFNIK